MSYSELNLLAFQKRFRTEHACEKALERMRWPEGYACPKCGHRQGYRIESRRLIACAACRYQVSLTAGTIFHKTRTPLVVWFWALYLVSQDKGGESALRLAKQLGIRYKTAWLMLHKIRQAMGERNRRYPLSGRIEMDDAFFGGVRAGKRGRGAANKTPVLVMVESQGKKRAGFVAMRTLPRVDRDRVHEGVAEEIQPGQAIRTDGLSVYDPLTTFDHTHEGTPVPPQQAAEALPWVHTVISNAKRFLLGTYHGVSHRHLQRYLDEFCYRFNRRTWEPQLPMRLLRACVTASAELRG